MAAPLSVDTGYEEYPEKPGSQETGEKRKVKREEKRCPFGT
jgi:hypothetical protein